MGCPPPSRSRRSRSPVPRQRKSGCYWDSRPWTDSDRPIGRLFAHCSKPNERFRMRYEALNLPVSTADAEAPRITLENGQARVAYCDWRSKSVVLLFHDVVAISWDDGDAALSTEHRDDRSYIVYDSPWLARHREAQTIMPTEDWKHFPGGVNSIRPKSLAGSRSRIMIPPVSQHERSRASDVRGPKTPSTTAGHPA